MADYFVIMGVGKKTDYGKKARMLDLDAARPLLRCAPAIRPRPRERPDVGQGPLPSRLTSSSRLRSDRQVDQVKSWSDEPRP